jgi:hypothetical protein
MLSVCIAEIIDINHHSWPGMGSNIILLVSASQVAEIAGIHHCTKPLTFSLLNRKIK